MLKLKLFVSFILFSLFISCNDSLKTKPYFADKQSLYQHVYSLTHTPQPRNYLNLASLNQSAAYIDSVFKRHSAFCEEQSFNINGNEYKNIISSFGPRDGERIVIGAHYDVCGNQPGADDNASAVAGLLELTRLLSTYNKEFKYRIDCVAFTLEEPPFFATDSMGSAIYAKKLIDEQVDIKLMACLEMIGYYDTSEDSQNFPVGILNWIYPSTGDFILLVSNFSSHFSTSSFKKDMRKVMKMDVRQITAPASMQGIDFSDHRNFWKHKIKALMITDTAFFRNHNYHKTSDTIETLDFNRIADVVTGTFYALVNIK